MNYHYKINKFAPTENNKIAAGAGYVLTSMNIKMSLIRIQCLSMRITLSFICEFLWQTHNQPSEKRKYDRIVFITLDRRIFI